MPRFLTASIALSPPPPATFLLARGRCEQWAVLNKQRFQVAYRPGAPPAGVWVVIVHSEDAARGDLLARGESTWKFFFPHQPAARWFVRDAAYEDQAGRSYPDRRNDNSVTVLQGVLGSRRLQRW